MSNFSKRKHYQNQIQGQEVGTLSDKQSIVKILRPKGNNLHQVEDGDGEIFLMSMPNKFRNAVYVKIGDFILVEAIDEGNKVRAQMVNVIDYHDIPIFTSNGIWPERFNYAYKNGKKNAYANNLSDDDEMAGNVNRPTINDSDSSEEDSDSDSVNSEKSDVDDKNNEIEVRSNIK